MDRYSAAVVRSPNDKTCHFFFFVDPTTKRLVFERRSIYTFKGYSSFGNDELFKGIIRPDASIAAVLQGDMVSVYGITEPEEEGIMYLSKLSPTLDVLHDIDIDGPIAHIEDPVASCSAGRYLTFVNYFTYDFDHASGNDSFQLNELELWGESNDRFSMRMSIDSPREVYGLCAVIHRETLVRYIFFLYQEQTGKPSVRCSWVCSGDQGRNHFIDHDFKSSDILAVASREGINRYGPYLDIFLYCLNPGNDRIFRAVGKARGHSIKWTAPSNTFHLKSDEKSSLAVINENKRNYVYYIPRGKDKYEAYIDVIQDDWFEPQGK
ncbi:uncharacterized protein KD926_001108 [Aspergillus affinis]|uniref:uncharacterized protein n=1 Tax=Aspergillus affinis TaxID=1070780 RepID=UPI0022FE9BC6|nr:uncharacterized protein KD926_001108 [Aspergillus affinis]KAI9037010.1 hypothetical protein KD926_001108 [Aspergillus affinis]